MKHFLNPRFPRRAFLAGLGAGVAHVLRRPLVAEADGLVPQRFLMVHRPCGSWPPDFLPPKSQPSGTNYQLTTILKPFEALRSKMVVYRGVDGPPNDTQNGDRHGGGIIGQVTGRLPVQAPDASADDRMDMNSKTITAATPSLDYFLQGRIPALQAPAGGPRAIHLSGNTRSGQGQHFACLCAISYADNNQPKYGEPRPTKNFTNILGSALVGGPGSTMDPATVERQLAQKKSVLDFVMRDLGRLQGQIPTSQRPKLDAHLEGIRLLESKISAGPPMVSAGCSKPALVPEPATKLSGREKDEVIHHEVCENNLAIIRAAFQCDLTRVASFTFADGNNDLHPRSYVPNPGFKIDGNHHDAVSHGGKDNPDAQEGKKETDLFYANLLAKVLGDMDQVAEGAPGQTLLDNTLAFYFSECSYGDDHEMTDLCSLLFGGKFLRLNVGNYLNFAPKIFQNDVWTSILNAWGMNVAQFGDPQFCKGSGPGAAKGLIVGT